MGGCMQIKLFFMTGAIKITSLCTGKIRSSKECTVHTRVRIAYGALFALNDDYY